MKTCKLITFTIIVGLFLLMCFSSATAQPRAIGGRIGWSIGPSYQHQTSKKTMIQTDVDFIAYDLGEVQEEYGIQGTVTFNWLVPLVSVNKGELNLYSGVGIGGGWKWGGPVILDDWFEYYRGTAFVGVAGMIGVEWRFKFPLQLSFEYRPLIGNKFSVYRGPDNYRYTHIFFNMHGLWASAVAVGIRYRFGGK
jgi:hypothetical protein